MKKAVGSPQEIYRLPVRTHVVGIAAAVLLLVLCWEGVTRMVHTWLGSEVFSHGILIPFISGYLIWQRRFELEEIEFRPSWWGGAVVAAGATLNLLGELAAIFTLQQYAFVVVLFGLVLALTGWKAMRLLAMPLAILLFMVPLPAFFMNNFSAQLQLISSQIGVWVVRSFGISVYLQGNVIDLGTYQLQVAEACDGLRYLFPLMTLAFIMAYLFRVELWKRIVLFLSSIPITILMNSFRIGTIGVMVEHWGVGMAEGFLHDFQGWVVFMASGALLIGEMAILARIGRLRRPWREVFGLSLPSAPLGNRFVVSRSHSTMFELSSALLLVCAAAAVALPSREEVVPARMSFLSFPQRIDGWNGRRDVMERVYLDTLQLDDYIMADFQRSGDELINLYVAWYDSQRSGASAHSPRSCLPGDGWQIKEFDQVSIPMTHHSMTQLRVNRVLISDGDKTQLVYYWFKQRGRTVTNEYVAKWYLFWDALTRNRTDGALVRLVSPLRNSEGVEAADDRLRSFAATIEATLVAYIPE